jgi:hypothetical protein
MDGYEVCETTIMPLVEAQELARPRIVVRNDRPAPTEPVWQSSSPLVCDGVRQLAVVVWARTKLLERILAGQVGVDTSLLSGLAKIDAAIVALSEPLDALEDTLLDQAA